MKPLIKSLSLAVALLLLGASLTSPQAAATQTTAATRTKVSVATISVEALRMDGAPLRADEEVIRQHLSAEAVKQAESVLLKRHIAQEIERVTSVQEATGDLVVSGTIRLPISVPSNLYGLAASSHKGEFATATFTVRDRAHRVVAEQSVALLWSDALWTTGARSRHNRPLDDVLGHFVRKATDRAVRDLLPKLPR